MSSSKNRMKTGKIAGRMADQFHLPRDLILGEPIVTVTGRGDLTVENYRGILVYETSRIRLSLKHGQLEILGNALNIDYYTNDDMKISGRIDKIEYGM
ncbi:MAG: YabP/YqfC family sporulation protein [Clostridiales bacterium]|nr:YabP/YqfC family sporulation protein [Clostridiales bacterium]MCD8156334.1 YabP/YqfC family sporulation protein [Clostridiales bacterium]MCD8324729.1 YabP/YqfC family sporulation protein [Clostridiales bacterium]